MDIFNLYPQNFLFELVLKYYMNKKQSISLTVSEIAHRDNKVAEIPSFTTKDMSKLYGQDFNQELFSIVNKISKYIMPENLKYTPDPGGGIFDYYTHPKALQKMINEQNFKDFSSDCDDFACYAYAALVKSGVPQHLVQLVTIIPQIFPSIWALKYAHVICVVLQDLELGEEFSDKGQAYTLDTNGLNVVPLLGYGIEVLKKFSNIYPVKYKYYLHHSYPFQVIK